MVQIREDISDRITHDQLGLWHNCFPLLVEPQWLQEVLRGDREALCGRKKNNGKLVQPRQALARKLLQFFEMNRRRHIANELGVSSNKVKTWERLDRISRGLAAESNASGRCNEEHFEELARYVKAEYGHDKNLPRRAKTVKGYFYRFSGECMEYIDDREDTMDKLSLEEAKELFQGVGMAELARCLQQLTREELAVIDVSFGLGMSKVHYRSVNDFITHHSLTQEQFTSQQEDVLVCLHQCLEINLAFQQGGTA
jgi:hypothetical protein